MRRFLKAVLLLAAPFVLLVVICDWRAASVHWNQYSAKKELLRRQLPETELLVLGSSHAYYGLMPGMLGKRAFNLSATGQSLFYDQALLMKYMDQMPHLKLVVVPVSYFALRFQLDEGLERWRCCYYKNVYGLPHRRWLMNWHLRNYSAFFLCGNSRMQKKLLLGNAPDLIGDYDSWGGWTNRPPARAHLSASNRQDHLIQSAREALKRHNQRVSPQVFSDNTNLLVRLVEETRRRQIDVLFLTLPVTSYYRDGMDAGFYAQMQTALRQVTAEPGVAYRDYTSDARFTRDDFEDGDHLNLAGAQKFSRILGEELIQPFWASRRRSR
jgi:hypothetical protein